MIRWKRPGRDPKWTALSEYSTLAMTLAFCVLIGLFVGKWIGGKLGHEDAGVLVGLTIGVVAAGVELTRSIRRIERLLADKRDENDDDATG